MCYTANTAVLENSPAALLRHVLKNRTRNGSVFGCCLPSASFLNLDTGQSKAQIYIFFFPPKVNFACHPSQLHVLDLQIRAVRRVQHNKRVHPKTETSTVTAVCGMLCQPQPSVTTLGTVRHRVPCFGNEFEQRKPMTVSSKAETTVTQENHRYLRLATGSVDPAAMGSETKVPLCLI